MTAPKLTRRQKKVFNVLEDRWQSASVIAARAGIVLMAPRLAASRMADKLVALGLAEKGGQRSTPQWRRKPDAAVSNEEDDE